MKFLKELYLGQDVHHLLDLKWKIRHGAGVVGLYVIYLGQNTNKIEIIEASFLKQKYLRKGVALVIGMTKSYDEAVQIVTRIVEEAISETGKADPSAFVLKKYS